MSDRIAKAYSNYLAYEKLKSKDQTQKKEPASGLLARRSMPSKTNNQRPNKLSELDKVASYVENIRKYRMS